MLTTFEDHVVWQRRVYRVKFSVKDRDITIEKIYNLTADSDTELTQLDLNRHCYHVLMARNKFGTPNKVNFT